MPKINLNKEAHELTNDSTSEFNPSSMLLYVFTETVHEGVSYPLTHTRTHTHTHTHTHTNTPLIVGPSQWVVPSEARHVNVVPDHHDVPYSIARVETAGRVGQEQRLHAHQLEDSYGQRDLVHVW